MTEISEPELKRLRRLERWCKMHLSLDAISGRACIAITWEVTVDTLRGLFNRDPAVEAAWDADDADFVPHEKVCDRCLRAERELGEAMSLNSEIARWFLEHTFELQTERGPELRLRPSACKTDVRCLAEALAAAKAARRET